MPPSAQHEDPVEPLEVAHTNGTSAWTDPYALGWPAELKPPQQVQLLRMDVKRMWPVRLLHKATLPVQYEDPFYNQLYDAAREYSWLAHFADVLVGDCCARVEPVRAPDAASSDPPAARRLYIMTLGVLEPYRGRGIGAHLLRRVMLGAYNSGSIDHIALHVQTTNEKALAFYAQFGFEQKGKVADYYAKLEDRDAFLLERAVPRK
eukprot:TRINITY_DN67127_c0_g1_i1.p1 TRINITY_DN67127_c0_g1~~TRINITY_DN67127_c0_g1_i1.p1  ORF type:complete len:206 (+),score=66.86 TRINITY_DN67127_c0_g1_i1:92-709(+)